MYRTLFDIAGIGMLGWLLLVLLPTWRVTRRIAESAIFPLFLCVLYVIGVVTALRELGPGILADFGSANGVVDLLSRESVALVAWIHILAFDQIAGILIYRDNMKGRFVPIPLQSVLLVATLMLGPLGFLSYWAVRTARRRDARVAWGERDPEPVRDSTASSTEAPRFHTVVRGSTLVGRLVGLWRRHQIMPVLGLLGFGFAAVTTIVAAANGGWRLEPEGRLLEAVKFDIAIGIFLLTLGLILPLAPMTSAGRRRWLGWVTGLSIYNYLMENVQAWRGLNPRFTEVGGPVDQILGGVFFLTAVGILVLFVILMYGFFRRDALPDHPALRLALRYATLASLIAFGVGVLMSAISGRNLGAHGDLMLIHAAGFHGLQAIPLIALLVGAAAVPTTQALGTTGLGGAGWLLLCAGMVIQATMGQGPSELRPALAITLVGALIWAIALVLAVRTWANSRAVLPASPGRAAGRL